MPKPFTDDRLDTKACIKLRLTNLVTTHYYYLGMMSGRDDPLVRAAWVRYDEETARPVHRVFSYDELIATAWLLHGGLDRHSAPALVREGWVIAARMEEDEAAYFGWPEERNGLTYAFWDTLIMPNGDRWLIAAPVREQWPAADDLLFRGDYGCEFVKDGEYRDLDDEELPRDLFRCGLGRSGLVRVQPTVTEQLIAARANPLGSEIALTIPFVIPTMARDFLSRAAKPRS